jgi:hypothetical protein
LGLEVLFATFLLFDFVFLLLFWMGVYCGIYKINKYIILHHSPLFPPHPHSWTSLNSSHFFHLHTGVHSICTIFNLLQAFINSSPSHWYQSFFRHDLFCPPVLIL